MHPITTSIIIAAFASLTTARSAAAEPTATEWLTRATAILAPDEFTAELTFTTRKANSEVKSFTIRMWKKGTQKTRFKFLAPTDDRDMEVLRVGDSIWNFLPNLKRSVRVSSKQEFHGGDFANADVLRVDLVQDYDATLDSSSAVDERLIVLTAKNDQVAYHTVKFWLRAKDAMPLRQEFFSTSGKLVRKLEFAEPKKFGKLVRPSKYVMRNMLVRSRTTELAWNSMSVAKLDDDSLFEQANLGH